MIARLEIFLRGRTLAISLALALFSMFAAQFALAQSASSDSKPEEFKSAEARPADSKSDYGSYLAIQLNNVTTQYDANDIQTALRNLLPRTKIYYVPSQAMLTLRGTAEDIKMAQRIVGDLDRPKRTYRLTYTIRDVDGGKTLGTQHYTVLVTAGGKTTFRQGTRVPLVTGSYDTEKSGRQEQVQYIDAGMNLEASLEGYVDGLRLKTKVEQSGVSDDKSGIGPQDPVIRQTVLEATSSLVEGKPVLLGTLDKPGDGLGSSRKREIEVLAEVVK